MTRTTLVLLLVLLLFASVAPTDMAEDNPAGRYWSAGTR